MFDTLNFNHSINWNPTNTGTYIIEIWASNLNGNVDLNPVNDIFTDTIHVWNNIAIRKTNLQGKTYANLAIKNNLANLDKKR